MNKKIYIFCPILMKLGENDQFMRQIFSPSYIRIKQKIQIFYYDQMCLFFAQTLITVVSIFVNGFIN